ncbi:MAG: glycoside hydrolase family 13 protein [Oscillospiraceae bacterium]
MYPPIYDSKNPLCKAPFGAAPHGEEITFRIFLPKSLLTGAPRLKLFLMDRWDAPILIPMELEEMGYSANAFACRFRPEEPALYAYCFEVPAPEGVKELTSARDGTGDFDDNGGLWQLTVYDAAMKTPPFLGEGVMYQIFPDRFNRGGAPKEDDRTDRVLREDWNGVPEWRPNHNGIVENIDFFQGDLEGIRRKLDYLVSLGVTVLYLNPIFEAHSNHRYDTADYRSVDPLLGGEEDFRLLCAEAKEKGVSILLDGVFSHTGADSVYFNKEKHYGEGGAYNDPDSPYRSWYKFSHYPDKYESWWGFETLPNVEETDPSFLEFICGEEGVLSHWLEQGVSGYRLDVADELPDKFLDALHKRVKAENPDAAVLGEVWEDASNKVSYGVRRRYLLGGQLESVMNYPFMNALLQFLRSGNGRGLYETVMRVLENYPPPVIAALMNPLSTHDTERAITVLGGEELSGRDREWQAAHMRLSPQQYGRGRSLYALGGILLYGLPGIPCIYYGDEAGLTGYKDPFNRACYPWGHEDEGLVDFFRILGGIRKAYPIFAEASFEPVTFSSQLASFVRRSEDGSKALLFAVNRGESPLRLTLPKGFEGAKQLAAYGHYTGGTLDKMSGVVLLWEK